MKKQVWIVFMVLGLAAMACSINLPVNLSGGGTGETQTLRINESYDTDEGSKLKLEMGAGDLTLSGGGDNLVNGTIRYNIEQWKPEILRDGNSVIIRQIIDTIDLTPQDDTINEWDLQLGSQPLELTIQAGAYSGQFDFSGVPLTGLVITDGASDTDIHFDTPNPARMEKFKYTTGASDLTITGLGNANTKSFEFTGGAGKAVLDFSGKLTKDMEVRIDGGAGDIHIIVPEGTSCVLISKGSLVNISYHGWKKDGDTYTVSGNGPQIEFTANLSVGNLELDVE